MSKESIKAEAMEASPYLLISYIRIPVTPYPLIPLSPYPLIPLQEIIKAEAMEASDPEEDEGDEGCVLIN